ncbi:MAG: glycoside hydrolase, partial [Clostridia bacterium]|nr:glycoside hydrolase [Clostridia bacterium]
MKGIDVSLWQGEIDWKAVKADGVSFAMIKASEGG